MYLSTGEHLPEPPTFGSTDMSTNLISEIAKFYARSLSWFVFRTEHIAYVAKRFNLPVSSVEEIAKNWNQLV